jgi:hypothetical protein
LPVLWRLDALLWAAFAKANSQRWISDARGKLVYLPLRDDGSELLAWIIGWTWCSIMRWGRGDGGSIRLVWARWSFDSHISFIRQSISPIALICEVALHSPHNQGNIGFKGRERCEKVHAVI